MLCDSMARIIQVTRLLRDLVHGYHLEQCTTKQCGTQVRPHDTLLDLNLNVVMEVVLKQIVKHWRHLRLQVEAS